ncbi:MAG: Fe-S cluster assembly ATPase SufC [Gammaproteobacteria bacterium]
MLKLENLCVSVDNTPILKNLNLIASPGTVHVIMGPNGSGKTTLASVLAGHDAYEITQGKIIFNQEEVGALSPEERAWRGLFLSFQQPVAIPGISNIQFLKSSLNAIRVKQGLKPFDAMDLLKQVKQEMQGLEMDEDLLYRAVNDGFSGGEKKRNEILQMLLLSPKLCILDETDSGLDIDALRLVAQGINKMRKPDTTIILITHYQRLLDYVVPDFIHILMDGEIKHTGDKHLALTLEEKGYAWVKDHVE